MHVDETTMSAETPLFVISPLFPSLPSDSSEKAQQQRRRSSKLWHLHPSASVGPHQGPNPSPSSSSSSSAPVAFQFHLSPFVSLTALSAIVFLLIPNDFLYSSQQQQNPKGGGELLQYFTGEEEFCCGGGPFSFYAASIVSIPCERHLIHLCCEDHDRCYDQRHLNQSFCDDQFCSCLEAIRSSTYCETIAQPALCLATRVFGHLFHWSANCTNNTGEQMPPECLMFSKLNQQKQQEILATALNETIKEEGTGTGT